VSEPQYDEEVSKVMVKTNHYVASTSPHDARPWRHDEWMEDREVLDNLQEAITCYSARKFIEVAATDSSANK